MPTLNMKLNNTHTRQPLRVPRVPGLKSAAQTRIHSASSFVPYGRQVARHVPNTSASSAAPFDSSSSSRESQDGLENVAVPTTMMAGGKYGSQGSGATLEKQGLDLTQKIQSFELSADNSGGGGDIGKGIHNGGGGDDGDDGDDDDYFDEGDDGDGDDGFMRKNVIGELFDRASIDAVMKEWHKTLFELPAGLRMAVEMGLISTAQLLRWLRLEAKPNAVRTVARFAPETASRDFVGRLMADPAFLMRLGFEQALTLTAALSYEAGKRGNNFKKEMDLAAVNVTGLLAANAAVVWMLAPTRTFGAPNKFAWQSFLHSLPNHAFDRSGPLRQYTVASRLMGCGVKAAQLSAVGLAIGGGMSLATGALISARKSKDPSWEPSYQQPPLEAMALGMGAHLGLSANFRYQLIAGLDRYMAASLTGLTNAAIGTAVARSLNECIGEPIRLMLTGQPKRGMDWNAAREAARARMVAAQAAMATAGAVVDEEEEYEEVEEYEEEEEEEGSFTGFTLSA
ncbi:hypothetical protein PPROV_000283900 [Pycnococcus provasolii]|uniref:Uncharacterized protein n=1 Tax=Pycnococcus provasolii TaxID=41880 RepID=A0A830HAS7_9CHLO|nr:hypothetical protein PPROV_000283900 [Pycnococcus provasolii]